VAFAAPVAAPVAAQQRGTVEFGAFASAGRFDKSLTLDRGYGGGGHVGVFLDPRVALEFEKGEMRASRTLGRADVNVGLLTARLVVTPIKVGPVSFILGGGAGASTETNFLHSYGVNALIGAKIALGSTVALRFDGLSDWLANDDWKSYQSLHVGLSFFRSPRGTVRTVERIVEVPGPVQVAAPRADSVSADEQARRRQVERDYRALRDSLSRAVVNTPPSPSAANVTTMEERIHFATDKSDLSDSARAILDSKGSIFRANPEMRNTIVGNADERASDAYNMALGNRRAAAAKAYLVAQGINASRIASSSDGERNPLAAGTSTAAQGLNRRAEFRLLQTTETLGPRNR
jgi:peptidoglycan-associated lipoprotein